MTNEATDSSKLLSTGTRLRHNGKLRHIAESDAPKLNREVSCVPRISKTVSANDNPQARKSRSRPPAVCTYNESPVHIRAHASAISRGHIIHVWIAYVCWSTWSTAEELSSHYHGRLRRGTTWRSVLSCTSINCAKYALKLRSTPELPTMCGMIRFVPTSLCTAAPF